MHLATDGKQRKEDKKEPEILNIRRSILLDDGWLWRVIHCSICCFPQGNKYPAWIAEFPAKGIQLIVTAFLKLAYQNFQNKEKDCLHKLITSGTYVYTNCACFFLW